MNDFASTGPNRIPTVADLPVIKAEHQPNVSIDMTAPISEERGRLGNALHMTKRAVQTSVVMAEILPLTNEGSRLAIFGATEAATHNALAAGTSLGVATFVIEGAGGIVAASLFDTDVSKKIFAKVNEKAEKVGIPADKKLSPSAKVFWTFMGGTVVGMTLEEREDPNRTAAQNRRYSVFTSLWQGGALAVLGTATAQGINVGLEDPKKGLITAAALAGGVGVATRVKKHSQTIRRRFSKSDPEAK